MENMTVHYIVDFQTISTAIHKGMKADDGAACNMTVQNAEHGNSV